MVTDRSREPENAGAADTHGGSDSDAAGQCPRQR